MNIEKLLKKFEAEQIEAFYVENSDKAREMVVEIIEKKREECSKKPSEMKISWGGSVTLDQTGIRDEMSRLYDAFNPYSLPPQEQNEGKRKALLSDVFLMSANAITENGEIVNIDGNGNRLAGLIFGPSTVIIVAGINKITPDIKSAYKRIKEIACVGNAKRLNRATPCAENGKCGNCFKAGATICSHTVITRFSAIPDRIKLIIVGESLGY